MNDYHQALSRTPMTIAIVNHKGGTCKTTTTINLGRALAKKGYRVLLVDFDAQGSLSYSLGIADDAPTLAEAFFDARPLHTLVHQREDMDVLPAGAALADVELSIAKTEDHFSHLKTVLSTVQEDYDFILIDCPPSISLLTLNALVASHHVIVPMQLDVLALRGLDALQATLRKMTSLNPALSILGILPVMVDTRKNIQVEIRQYIESHFDVPLFDQSIRSCVRAAEAPSFGKSTIEYAESCTTAQDYLGLADEVTERSQLFV